MLSGIIPSREYLLDENNPIRIMAKAVLAGRVEPFSEEELTALVDQRYFSFELLIAITEAEKKLLTSNMVKSLSYSLNKGPTREFLQNKCYLVPDVNSSTGWHLYSAPSFRDSHAFDPDRPPMTDEEKIVFISQPENLRTYFTIDNITSSLQGMGYRSISEYDMFGSQESFTLVIRNIQKETGRDNLNILDLGGGVGRALGEAKKLHPELVTYNATRDEEYGVYDIDFQVVYFLECMPRQLQGKIDFIFSNMATRYLAFCDLTIECCLAILAPGGIMNVFFSSESSCNNNTADVKKRMKRAYEYLKDLESSGIIKLDIKSSYSSNLGGSFQAEEGSLYPASNVRVVKL